MCVCLGIYSAHFGWWNQIELESAFLSPKHPVTVTSLSIARRMRHYKIRSASRDYRFYACGMVIFIRFDLCMVRQALASTPMALYWFHLEWFYRATLIWCTAWTQSYFPLPVRSLSVTKHLCTSLNQRLISAATDFLPTPPFFVRFLWNIFYGRKISWDSLHLPGFLNATAMKYETDSFSCDWRWCSISQMINSQCICRTNKKTTNRNRSFWFCFVYTTIIFRSINGSFFWYKQIFTKGLLFFSLRLFFAMKISGI